MKNLLFLFAIIMLFSGCNKVEESIPEGVIKVKVVDYSISDLYNPVDRGCRSSIGVFNMENSKGEPIKMILLISNSRPSYSYTDKKKYILCQELENACMNEDSITVDFDNLKQIKEGERNE